MTRLSEHTDLLVVGGGMAGLVAARTAAAGGLQVAVLEAATDCGGMVGAHEVDGLVLDTGAESFATAGGAVADLANQVGLSDQVVSPHPIPALVHHEGGTYSLPAKHVLGVPTDLQAPELDTALGVEGLRQAQQDAYLPPAAGADERSLAGFVRARMGQQVLDRLVRPVVRVVHSVEPEDLHTDALVSDLPARVAAAGSLAAALDAVGRRTPGGSATQGLKGGVHGLVSALAADLEGNGVRLVPGTPVRSLDRRAGRWRVTTRAGETWSAGAVLLACPPHEWAFLDPSAAPDLVRLAADWPAPSTVDLVTLVLDATQLPRHRRGGVLVTEPGANAKALTYATAKWDWLAQIAGPEREVLRLAYPAGSHAPAEVGQVLLDAARLLQIQIPEGALRAHARIRMTLLRPVHASGMAARVRHMRQALASLDDIDAAGAWIAGTGLAAVVPDAEAAAARLVSRLRSGRSPRSI